MGWEGMQAEINIDLISSSHQSGLGIGERKIPVWGLCSYSWWRNLVSMNKGDEILSTTDKKIQNTNIWKKSLTSPLQEIKIQVLTIYYLALIKTRTKINRYLFYSIYLYICININTLYKQVYIYILWEYIYIRGSANSQWRNGTFSSC